MDQGVDRADLRALRDELRLEMFRLVGNARRSIVADGAAHQYLTDRLRPRSWIPAAGGWVISYEALAGMVDHLLSTTAPQSVVETGSGISTVWLGHALRELGGGHLTAFEHDPLYAERTRAQLRKHGLQAWCRVIDAPLVDASTTDGPWPPGWYDLSQWSPEQIDLLLIDGPPGADGPLARDPAYRVFAPHLGPGALVVVDDIDRADEQAMVDGWTSDESFGSLRFVGDHGVSRFLSFDPREETEGA